MPSQVSIANDALAELPSAPIADLDERSLEARECKRAYEPALAYLLEQHDWSFANRRVALVATANDRASEWAYAYAKPTGVATIKKLVPDFEGTGLGIPVEGPFSPPYYELWGTFGGIPEPIFIEENGVIYTSLPNATLEYGAASISEAVMPVMFARALALEIASRVAMPIKKDRELKGDLIKQAEAAKDRAMADDMNRHPTYHGASYMSEVAMVRR